MRNRLSKFVLISSDEMRLVTGSQRSLRAQEAPPDAKFCNPTGLVHQFAFFAHALLLIPHGAIYCFPVRIDPVGERWLSQAFRVNNGRGHRYHPLAAYVSNSFVARWPAKRGDSRVPGFPERGRAETWNAGSLILTD